MKKLYLETGVKLEDVGLVSVIVPIYNAEKFLDMSLQSLQNQTYSYWEAILINDGSTDNSLDILQKYAVSDSRFKIINQNNQGVAIARNVGLDAAKGKYIAFLDPDDMLCPQFMEVLLEALLKSDSDMAWCRRKNCYEDDGIEVCETYRNFSVTYHRYALDYYIRHCSPRLTITVWGKIYKAEIVKNLRFHRDFLKMAEDFEFSLRAFEFCGKTVNVKQKMIVYRQNNNSLTHHAISFEAVDDHIRLLRYTVWHFKDALDRKIRLKLWRILSRMVFLYVCILPYQTTREYMAFWQKYQPVCRELEQCGEFFPHHLSYMHRFLWYLFSHHKYDELQLILCVYQKIHHRKNH